MMNDISFNLKYLSVCVLIALGAFIVTILLMPGFIGWVTRKKFGQEVRELGPKEHQKKQGTPTMGGAVFLIGAVSASVLGMILTGSIESETLKILFLTLGFGLIGAADDYLKISRHNSDGLEACQKLTMQLILAVILAVWVYSEKDMEGGLGRVLVPFTGNFETALTIHMPLIIFVVFSVFVTLGTDNGVNFTDGLDGLCGSVTAIVAALFVMVGLANSTPGLSYAAAGMLGGLLGFLLFNVYPAKIFMGDTGSLALGGFVAAVSITGGMELYIPVFGFVYLAEVLSVIIQVTYFKHTGGRRLFLMSPIHHHFELLGNSETRIVAAFSVMTFFLALVSFLGVCC